MSFINDIYVSLKNLFQKHGRGFISPDEFNDAISYTQDKIIRESFDFINTLKNNSKIGRINKRNYDKEKYYNEVIRALEANADLSYNSSTERFAFPDDYSFVQAIYYGTAEVEEIPSDERIILHNFSTMPSENYPLSVFHGTDIEILPDTIIDDVKMYYYRDVKKPNWTYNTIDSSALFYEDADDYQDLEIPRQFSDEVLVEVAKYLSIEIRQPDMSQAFSAEEKKNEVLKRE